MVFQHGERNHGATRCQWRGCGRLCIPSLQLGARRRTLQGCWRSEHTICAVDPEVWQAIKAENKQQHEHIELVASENYASPAVMEAQGST